MDGLRRPSHPALGSCGRDLPAAPDGALRSARTAFPSIAIRDNNFLA